MKIGKKDVAWGYLSLLLVHGINAILLPFILFYLEEKEIGLWYTFTSLYGLAMLIDFGLKATISRNISFVWAGAEDIYQSGYDVIESEKKINVRFFKRLLETIKSIYYAMGSVIFLILTTGGTYYIYLISRNELELKIVILAWAFYLLSIVLNIMFAFWESTLRGVGAIAEYNKALITAKISQFALSILFLYLGFGILGVTFAYFLSVLVNRMLLTSYFYKYSDVTKSLKGKIRLRYSKELLMKMLPNTLKTGITSFANYLIINFPILLSSYFLSLEISGKFGFINQIITLCITVSNSYFNTYLAKFNYLRVKGMKDELIHLFKKTIIINYLINILLFTGVIFLGQPMLNLLRTNYILLPSSLLIAVMLYRFLYNNQMLFATLFSTKNIIPYYKAFIYSSILTVITQLLLLNNNANLWSIILPIIIVQLFYNNWYWPLKTIQDLKYNKF